MGLSASQGRMLLLTARKSDLEFRAQQISQRRLILAQQLEDISSEYEEATSNRQMKIRVYADEANAKENTVTNKSINLTYAYLVSGTVNNVPSAKSGIKASKTVGTDNLEYASTSYYRLKDPDGAIVVASEEEIPNLNNYNIVNGKAYPKNASPDDHKPVYRIDTALRFGISDADGSTDGPNYLQDCLRNGKYLIEKSHTEDDNEITWHGISWDATANISDSYYQGDDDAAKAKYDRMQTQIQNQDKKLELELDSVETQRNAVKTEIDSVDKVISENIEKTFNAFG